jgi:hypothetical protein
MPFQSDQRCRKGTLDVLRKQLKLGFKCHLNVLRHACSYGFTNDGKDTRSLQAYQGKAGKATNGSTLRQPRLAQPIKTMLDILGVLEEDNTLVALNRVTGVDPQHLRGFFARLLKLSRLRIGACQGKMRPLQIVPAQCAVALQTHRISIALEHVIGQAPCTNRKEERLKRVKADVRLQYLERSCRLAREV